MYPTTSPVIAERTPVEQCVRELAIEEVSCGLCGSQSPRILFRETYRLGDALAELGINRCAQCGLVYTSPRLTFASVQAVYRHDAEGTISHNYCWEGSSDGSRFEPLLRRLRAIAPVGRLLDVGCGAGHFLAEAKRIGHWRVLGIEPSLPAARQASRRSGTEVLAATLEEAQLPEESFDVVSLLGVLEHLHDPLGTLRRVRCLLKPKGALAIYVPNFSYLRLKDTGLVCYLRKGCWSDLHPQEHLFHFTPTTLTSMLDAAGFQLLRIDIGRPFSHGSQLVRRAKHYAYLAVRTLHAVTGWHLGGIEAICQRKD